MRTWLTNGAAAARLAADRPDLWLAGALGWLVYLGWLPLLLAVVPLPDAGDLQFFGASLIISGAFPANVVALAIAAVATIWLLMLLASAAEVAIGEGIALRSSPRGAGAVLTALAISLIASLPAIGATGALVLAITGVAPGEFQSSQLEVSVVVRILLAVWPYVAILLALVAAGQAFGALAIRKATDAAAPALLRALRDAAVDLLRHAIRRLATAAVWLLLDALLFVLTLALLRVLWAPVGADLAAWRLIDPANLVLLVGFVAIWLILGVGAGAVQLARSTWWSLESGRTIAQPVVAIAGVSPED